MMEKMETGRRVVVSGTDTGVGKTVCAALMTAVLDAHYWKPVQAGLEEETDSETVLRTAEIDAERVFPEGYRLTAPMSPDQAAAREGVTLDHRVLIPPVCSGDLVIEGAGGLMVPLNRSATMIDLFAAWGLPLILVARSGLGTLNHTLLSVEALVRRRVPTAGIVLVGDRHPENERTLEQWSTVAIVGRIPRLEVIDRRTLLEVYRREWRPIEEWLPVDAIGT